MSSMATQSCKYFCCGHNIFQIEMHIHQKNVLALCATFFIIQSAYMSLQNLASSLYADGGLGLASLAIIYGVYAISCLIAPSVIGRLGTKNVIIAAMFLYCIYIASNLYPTYLTLLPAAALMGIGAGPLWSAQGTHLTTSAINLADLTSESHEAIISRFNGVFFAFFLASQIPGNLVTSVVMYSGENSNNTNTNGTESELHYCGPNDGGFSSSSNKQIISQEPDQSTVYILFGVLLLWGLLSIPTAALFMNSLESYCPNLPEKRSAVKQMKATFELILNPKMFLLIPLILYNGIELGFAYGDFTKSYISCTQGLQAIGFIMTAYGVAGGISALILGIISKYTGRIAIFTAGFISQTILMILMISWDPNKGELWHLYMMAIVWAFGGALRESQVAAFLGVLFADDQEPAFANFRFWQAIAYCIAFGSSIPNLLVRSKLTFLLASLLLGMGLYYLLEWRIRNDLTEREEPESKIQHFDKPHMKNIQHLDKTNIKKNEIHTLSISESIGFIQGPLTPILGRRKIVTHNENGEPKCKIEHFNKTDTKKHGIENAPLSISESIGFTQGPLTPIPCRRNMKI